MMISCRTLSALLGLVLLASCSQTPEPVRYGATPPALERRISIPHRTVALREVSLPAYAADEEISVASGSGAIREFPGSIWADDPIRAVTLRLTNALSDLTGRTVASDPWPFQEDPDVVVDVRIEDFIAQASGRFVAKGRYYVAYTDSERSDRSRSFELSQSYDPEMGFSAIADARSKIIASLALDIAQRGLR